VGPGPRAPDVPARGGLRRAGPTGRAQGPPRRSRSSLRAVRQPLRHDGGAGAHAVTVEETLHVGFHGLGRHPEDAGDLLPGIALGDEGDDLGLTSAEPHGVVVPNGSTVLRCWRAQRVLPLRCGGDRQGPDCELAAAQDPDVCSAVARRRQPRGTPATGDRFVAIPVVSLSLVRTCQALWRGGERVETDERMTRCAVRSHTG
jgi:hypothetical protein